MTGAEAYRELERRFRRIQLLNEVEEVLSWDQSTMMPAGGAGVRAEQTAELNGFRHGLLVATETGELLATAAGAEGLNMAQQAN